jgi:membrane associated rhomboid family serine protease
MRRYPSTYASSFSFGPGPISTALKALIGINVVTFVAQIAFPVITTVLGLHPAWIIPAPSPFPPEHVLWVWQLATYMFLHGGIFHIVFNMLALWMFGTELERTWGTRYFLKFYLVVGVGAAALTVLFSLLPFGFARQLQHANVIGASGAIYGLLLAHALYFPDRPIYMYLLFPIPAKIFVAIMGAIAFLSSMSDAGGVANATHLGGLAVAYLFLRSARIHPISELKYRYLKWKINRVRKKFDVYSGGRGADDYDRRVH